MPPPEVTYLKDATDSVKVIRNSRGYNWEIKVYSNDLDKALERIKEADAELKKLFGDDVK